MILILNKMPTSKNSIFSLEKKVGKHLTVYVNNLKGRGHQLPETTMEET